ncbi:WD40 repeat-like protein [Aulographum hederae CBS 113979]|uniref:WD40 repeat-like protein n=1 Tax=Aulographum hederae CBS 113979 TaxID=1176131 RepID=A0A6G1HB24_9PEZI|nr:WD40 repeat-like protein [Aulographum hederae CBS 113979]
MFHSHHSSPHGTSQPGTAQGLFQAAQSLGSVGAPQGNLHNAASGTTGGSSDSMMRGGGNSMQNQVGGGQTLPSNAAPQAPGASPATSNYAQYETPQRRMPDELQLQHGHGMHQQQSPDHRLHNTSNVYSAGTMPGINLQQATPQGAHFVNSDMSPGGVPSSLQAGASARPGPAATYTAPTTVPTMPQINTNAQQYTLPTRSNTTSASHSYSRSSPAAGGTDQKYVPFSSNSETPKYPPTPNQKYPYGQYSPQTPSGSTAHSPLVLEHIRPRANSNMDESMGGGTMWSEMDRQPTNSNYLAPWALFAFDWCKWPVHGSSTSAGKMAIGSHLEDPHNFIQILDTQVAPQETTTPGSSPYGLEYTKVAEATCSYPVTRILWEPPSSQKQSTDLLATSGDHLRLWSLPQSSGSQASNTISRSSSVNTREPAPQKLTPLALLSNSKTPEHTAPLTSLDWNTLSPKLIITSSIDTTCTIWDIPTLTAKTQLIAHDKEVFDVRFCAGSVDVFVSCGADGSVRMFDLRSLEHSTIIYEPAEKSDKDKGTTSSRLAGRLKRLFTYIFPGSPGGGRMSPTKAQQTMSYSPPLLRLAASPHDSHLLATFAADSNIIRILDVRQPGQALLELRGHAASVSSIEWSPTRRGMLASGGDDSLVLVWDLYNQQNGASLNGEAGTGNGVLGSGSGPIPQSGNPTTPASAAGAGGQVGAKGPAASWRCEYEVGNLSWAPGSALTGQGGEWLGVAGGRGVWGVKL